MLPIRIVVQAPGHWLVAELMMRATSIEIARLKAGVSLTLHGQDAVDAAAHPLPEQGCHGAAGFGGSAAVRILLPSDR